MPIETHLDGTTARIVVPVQHSAKDLYRPRGEVRRVLQHGVKTVILDLANVRFLDKPALLDILGSHILAVKAQAKMQVINPTPEAADLLDKVGIASIVELNGPQG